MDTVQLSTQTMVILTVAIIWTMTWKGIALWNAARNGHKKWFVALLILNTVGVLEIIYLYVLAPKIKKNDK